MSDNNSDWLEQLDRHLASPCLTWLLGAGVSYGARIPLMYPLTARVSAMAVGEHYELLINSILQELPDGSHIEHVLSHLGDYTALAERSSASSVTIGDIPYSHEQLKTAHEAILASIATTVRWGYVPGDPADEGIPENVGSSSNPLTRIGDGHLVLDRSGLLLGNFGGEQIRDDAGGLMLALDGRGPRSQPVHEELDLRMGVNVRTDVIAVSGGVGHPTAGRLGLVEVVAGNINRMLAPRCDQVLMPLEFEGFQTQALPERYLPSSSAIGMPDCATLH